MNFAPYLATWIPLAVFVGALALYRNMLASHEDETIHVLESDAPAAAAQAKLSRKLQIVERWGKLLTIVVILYGLVIAGMYFYLMWQQGSQLPG